MNLKSYLISDHIKSTTNGIWGTDLKTKIKPKGETGYALVISVLLFIIAALLTAWAMDVGVQARIN